MREEEEIHFRHFSEWAGRFKMSLFTLLVTKKGKERERRKEDSSLLFCLLFPFAEVFVPQDHPTADGERSTRS
jgi:hypothetical protein